VLTSFIGGALGSVAGLGVSRLIWLYYNRRPRRRYRCPVCGSIRTIKLFGEDGR